MKTKLIITVRSTDIDFLGHVSNTRYLEYLQWGREEWYSEAGYKFEQMLVEDVVTLVANINIDYLKAVYMGQRLVLETEPHSRGNKSFVLRQDLNLEESGEKVSAARVTIVAVDQRKGETIALPPALLAIVEGYPKK